MTLYVMRLTFITLSSRKAMVIVIIDIVKDTISDYLEMLLLHEY